MEFIIGLILGAAVVALLAYYFRSIFIKDKAEQQSVILLEKIRNVSKLITIESDFTEIMHHQDSKNLLLNLFKSDKKAIVLANSKVMVGFDMKQIRIKPEPENRTIKLIHFPQPQVLSIETNLEYYDISNGLFNKFDAADLTKINKKVKENIELKIPQSGILNTAQEKALDTIKMIEQIVDTFGWKLDYHQLELPKNIEIKKITDGQKN
jgi:hypothetical protein